MAYNKELRVALAAFRKGVKPLLKTATNPHFKSKYAPLDAVVEAFKEALDAAGLVVEQWTMETEGNTYLHTRIVHVETGETSEESVCRLRIPVGRDDMPSLGSAQTYARRQQLLLAAMIAPEDDDGASIMERPKEQDVIKPGKGPVTWTPPDFAGPMTADTRGEIAKLFRDLRTTAIEVEAVCKKTVGKGKPSDTVQWTEGEGQKLVTELKCIQGEAQ